MSHHYPARSTLPANKEPAPTGFKPDLTTVPGLRAALSRAMRTEEGQSAAVAQTGMRSGLLRAFIRGDLFGKSEVSTVKAFLNDFDFA